MRIHKAVMAVMLAGFVFAGLSGCEKEGPAEQAGEAVDEAVSGAVEQVEEAAEAVEQKVAE